MTTNQNKRYSSGNFFSPNAKFFGYIFLVFAIGLIIWDFFPDFDGLSKSYISFVILPFPLYLIFTTYGVEIDFREKKIRDYKMVMGFILKNGEYNKIKQNFITILPLLRSYYMQTRANMGTSVSERMLTVALISDNFKNKKEIWITDSKEEAKILAEEIAQKLNIQLIKYEPKRFRRGIKTTNNK